MRFLSFGGGVQSTTMLMMALDGLIERPDHVIFSDTGWEPKSTYRIVDFAKAACEKEGLPFHVVSSGNIRADMIRAHTANSGQYDGHFVTMPLFVRANDGSIGMIKRQCTSEYKLAPIRKKQRELLGYKPRQRIPAHTAETLIGITIDEARRAAPSRDSWVDNLYPLIDPLKLTRADCQAWWETHFPHIPLGKSSCIGCPFKSDAGWRHMKLTDPAAFEDACDFDAAVRGATGLRGEAYLHSSCKPLREINFNEGQGELDLDDQVLCAGGCGL